jgi:threonine synthase
MRFISTRKKSEPVNLKQAILDSLAPDGGLYLPEKLMPLDKNFFKDLEEKGFNEIAYEVCGQLIGDSLSRSKVEEIIDASITFTTPLVPIKQGVFSLELWHGPTLAFKDFGARFMSQLVSYLTKDDEQKTTILVATSGDTGGAVASGFDGAENVDVIILYPKAKVSKYQRLQMTTGSSNVHALEVDGAFDDCQKIVKTAFMDSELNKRMQLSSANSINIGRLIPQCFYYFEAYKQLSQKDVPVAFSVPSGNFGNLCAGLMTKAMGLKIDKFIAATNINDTVPEFFKTGVYKPKPSQQTISNAMDVGDPSNMERILHLYQGALDSLKKDVLSYSINDEETKDIIQKMESKYLLDPHGAVAYAALEKFLKVNPAYQGVILETAHPSKFLSVMNNIIGEIPISEKLLALKDLKEEFVSIPNDYDDFKQCLLSLSNKSK